MFPTLSAARNNLKMRYTCMNRKTIFLSENLKQGNENVRKGNMRIISR